jgi:hypothetical protein
MNFTLKLTGLVARAAAIRRINECPDGCFVTIKEPTRTLEQNALLHALLTPISKQCKYLGHLRSVDFWRGLFVSGWEIATGRKPEIVPGLEGEFLNIRQSTTTMSKRDLSSLVEYIEAWAAMHGVRMGREDE